MNDCLKKIGLNVGKARRMVYDRYESRSAWRRERNLECMSAFGRRGEIDSK